MKLEPRAFAQWEIDYREAFGIFVDFHPVTGEPRRRTLITDKDFEAALAEDEAITPPAIDRSRWNKLEACDD